MIFFCYLVKMFVKGGFGRAKILEHFFQLLTTLGFFLSAGRKNSVEKPNIFSKANNIIFSLSLFCLILQNLTI